MIEETKVPEAPVEEVKPEATVVDEPLIDNRRAEVEKLVMADNGVPAEQAPVEAPEVEEKKEEPSVDAEEVSDDPIERMKKAVQKRIDKVIAKSKSVEEKLADAEAELARLRATPEAPKETPTTKDDAPPTIEQIEGYIIKMREEGNVKEEIAATRYLIKVEKELAIKEFQDTQTKTVKETEAQKSKQLKDWTMLSKDYETTDPKDEMNLNNQNGLLYKTALSLFNDKELHADHYNNPDVIQGFRRAVADAYREIHQQGLIKTPKGEVVTEKKSLRAMLADPSTQSSEEPTPPNNSNSLSDAEKVREEIRSRNKNLKIKR